MGRQRGLWRIGGHPGASGPLELFGTSASEEGQSESRLEQARHRAPCIWKEKGKRKRGTLTLRRQQRRQVLSVMELGRASGSTQCSSAQHPHTQHGAYSLEATQRPVQTWCAHIGMLCAQAHYPHSPLTSNMDFFHVLILSTCSLRSLPWLSVKTVFFKQRPEPSFY